MTTNTSKLLIQNVLLTLFILMVLTKGLFGQEQWDIDDYDVNYTYPYIASKGDLRLMQKAYVYGEKNKISKFDDKFNELIKSNPSWSDLYIYKARYKYSQLSKNELDELYITAFKNHNYYYTSSQYECLKYIRRYCYDSLTQVDKIKFLLTYINWKNFKNYSDDWILLKEIVPKYIESTNDTRIIKHVKKYSLKYEPDQSSWFNNRPARMFLKYSEDLFDKYSNIIANRNNEVNTIGILRNPSFYIVKSGDEYICFTFNTIPLKKQVMIYHFPASEDFTPTAAFRNLHYKRWYLKKRVSNYTITGNIVEFSYKYCEGVLYENRHECNKSHTIRISKEGNKILDKEGNIVLEVDLSDQSYKCLLGDCVNGIGLLRRNNGLYYGEFKDHLYNGFGEHEIFSSDCWSGSKKNDSYKKYDNHPPIFDYKEYGDTYRGEYVNGQKHGEGRFVFARSKWSNLSAKYTNVMEGEFMEDKFVGERKLTAGASFRNEFSKVYTQAYEYANNIPCKAIRESQEWMPKIIALRENENIMDLDSYDYVIDYIANSIDVFNCSDEYLNELRNMLNLIQSQREIVAQAHKGNTTIEELMSKTKLTYGDIKESLYELNNLSKISVNK